MGERLDPDPGAITQDFHGPRRDPELIAKPPCLDDTIAMAERLTDPARTGPGCAALR